MNYIIRTVAYTDVSAVCGIMQTVYASLENKDLFVPDDRAFIEKHISEKGFILVAVNTDTDEISGFLIVRYPGMEKDNLGREILTDDMLLSVAHMESAAVLPAARGNGLEHRLLNHALSLLPDNIRYCFATVHPKNTASLKSFEKAGFLVIKHCHKYGGLERFVLKLQR